MTVKELAAMSGLTVRTLHHYDSIGLLCPKRNSINGYRVYEQAELDRLQQILFFRTSGLALGEITRILDCPDYCPQKALELQRQALFHQREQLDIRIQTVEHTILSLRGEKIMTDQEKFRGFYFSKNPYEAEARDRWGDKAIDGSQAAINKLDAEGKNELGAEMNRLFVHLAQLRSEPVGGQAVQAAVEEFYCFLNQNFGHHYTLEAFAGLGQTYVADQRFTKNIDQFGVGTTVFLAAAMEHYAITKA